MDASQALREIVEASGLTHRQIARRLGRYDSYVSQLLTRSGAPGADTLASVAGACGYRLELVPMDGSESLTIGDYEQTQPRAADQARALILRAAALLEQVDE